MATTSGGRDIKGTFVKTNDLGVLAAAAVLLVFSFFHWFTAKACFGAICSSGHASAWHAGILSWGGVLLGVLAAAAVGVRVFRPAQLPTLAVGPHVVALGLAGLGTLLVLLRFLIGYGDGGFGVKVHRGLGLYVGLIALVVETVFAFLAFTASGEALPGRPASSSPSVPPADPGAPTV